jgi:hypothetical protein
VSCYIDDGRPPARTVTTHASTDGLRRYPTRAETDRAAYETLFVIGAFCWLVAWAWLWRPR